MQPWEACTFIIDFAFAPTAFKEASSELLGQVPKREVGDDSCSAS